MPESTGCCSEDRATHKCYIHCCVCWWCTQALDMVLSLRTVYIHLQISGSLANLFFCCWSICDALYYYSISPFILVISPSSLILFSNQGDVFILGVLGLLTVFYLTHLISKICIMILLYCSLEAFAWQWCAVGFTCSMQSSSLEPSLQPPLQPPLHWASRSQRRLRLALVFSK